MKQPIYILDPNRNEVKKLIGKVNPSTLKNVDLNPLKALSLSTITEKERQEIDRGIELLTLCQELQSEKDGVDRPKVFETDKSKTLDGFAQDIQQSIFNMATLYRLYPMLNQLTQIGKSLDKKDIIQVDYSDSFAEKALEYLVDKHTKNLGS